MSVTINGSDSNVSVPAIAGTSSTAGVYFPSANVVAISTASTQRAVFDASGNFQFDSGYGSAATAYGCRAWILFNGTGTPSITKGGNVSSITDNGIGNYTVNLTNSMPDANYTCVTTPVIYAGVTDAAFVRASAINSSSFSVYAFYFSGTSVLAWDPANCQAAIFR